MDNLAISRDSYNLPHLIPSLTCPPILSAVAGWLVGHGCTGQKSNVIPCLTIVSGESDRETNMIEIDEI